MRAWTRRGAGSGLLPAFSRSSLNSAHLWAFADPTLGYFIQVAVHPLLGLTLAAVALWLLLARRFTPSPLGQAALAILAAGLALGLAVTRRRSDDAASPARRRARCTLHRRGHGAPPIFLESSGARQPKTCGVRL